ncbi:hypothetical protein BvCmsSIP046_04845 [Escherichia coli]|nr:hypothetical protein BvCmsSIP046_04845 [Escherichia coli]GDW46784.1 hypothetical protein BvCmsSIP036_04699 [Escherichia coli]
MFLPSDNHLAYFRTFPCVDVQNCTISDTKTAVVPPFWRFLKVLWLKNSLNVVYFPNSKLTPYSWFLHLRQTFLYPDSPSMATSVQYAILAGYTLFPTGCRPHKPEQNAGE